jgi:alcohol dehydrogenase class IV
MTLSFTSQIFTYNAAPARILFGAGRAAEIADELRRLECRRALILSTPSQQQLAEQIAQQLGELYGGSFTEAVMHTPVAVTEKALAYLQAQQCDSIVALGGGSTIGLGKALALRTDLPQVVLPTTYAGSEVTAILGQTEKGIKTTQRSPRILPEVVIYDVNLTLTLPPALSATSGMNALAHAVEALYARDANPIVSLMAAEGIRALARSLPRVVAHPDDLAARSDAQYGAWLCGTCLGAVGMALHHKICHVLGGTFDLPHAPTHTIMLPHALAYNAPSAPQAMRVIADALGTDDAVRGMYTLAQRLDTPLALRDIGMPESGITRAAELVMQDAYWNPRPLEQQAITAMLARAWAGEAPAS